MVSVSADIELELATKGDLDDAIAGLKRDLNRPYRERVFAAYSGKTDGNGNVGIRVYDVPDGMTFFVRKLIQWADGFTPASAFASAAGWTGLFHGNQPSAVNLADYAPYLPGGQIFPLTAEYSDDVIEFRQNDNVFFNVFSGPVNTNVTVMLFGELRSLRVRNNDRDQSLPKARGKQT